MIASTLSRNKILTMPHFQDTRLLSSGSVVTLVSRTAVGILIELLYTANDHLCFLSGRAQLHERGREHANIECSVFIQ